MLLNRAIHKIMNILYGLVMALPLISIAVTCLYVIINKNAYESYNGSYMYDTTQSTNYGGADSTFYNALNSGVSLIEVPNFEYLDFNISGSIDPIYYNGGNYSFILKVSEVTFYNSTLLNSIPDTYNALVYRNIYGYAVRSGWFLLDLDFSTLTTNFSTANGVDLSYRLLDFNTNLLADVVLTDTHLFVNSSNMYATSLTRLNTALNVVTNSFKSHLFVYDNTLSSVFYSSTNRVFESPLFNWVYDSFAYAPIGAFVSLFGVATHSLYDCLLTYWLVISLIWIGFEILMFMITFARQLINNFYSKTERW